jgi:hypothetical protein
MADLTVERYSYVSDEKIDDLVNLVFDEWCTMTNADPVCIHHDDSTRFEKYCRKCWKDYITTS